MFSGIWISFNHFGGYYYYDKHINVFSHLHMVGAGVADYGWLGVMPIQLPRQKNYNETLYKMLQQTYGLRSRFSHDYEVAEPGYYKVLLETYDIVAELTASEHSAVHRYTYRNESNLNVIVFDTSYTLEPKACAGAQTTIDLATKVGLVLI